MPDFEPLPPAFSARERALDPLLAAEDTNPLFEAFRRMRAHRKESPRKARFRAGALAAFGPYKLDEQVRQRAADLWLAGATGRMVVEAAYLDAAHLGRSFLGNFMTTAGITLVVGCGLVIGATPWGVAGSMIALAIYGILGRPTINLLNRAQATALFEANVLRWAVPPSRKHEAEGDVIGLVVPVLSTLAPLICPIFLLVLGFDRSPFRSAPERWALLHHQELNAACFAGFAILALPCRGLLRRWILVRMTRLMEEADAAFETHFRATIMDDPDPPSDLLPAFQFSERARDPRLKAEDTNGVWEALRRYRELYPKLRGERLRGEAKERTVGAFLRGPGRSPWLRDLWLAGATGRRLLEARYMELRLATRHRELLPPMATAVVPFAIALWRGTTFRHALPSVSFTLFYALIAWAALREFLRGRVIRALQEQVESWRGAVARRSLWLRPTRVEALAMGLQIAPAIAISATMPKARMENALVAAGLWMLVLGAVWGCAAGHLAGRNAANLEKVLAETDPAFESHFRRVAMEDPDA